MTRCRGIPFFEAIALIAARSLRVKNMTISFQGKTFANP
jgi:hypothetical protein